ncbi:hypothetical protein PR002_g31343 [Phytophthora rubi]|uniref:Uncharacterized protein n=1 Tax=Phytophthora rubi TaxID=129364 RepID=A0A6A3GKD6_9STRA|nr:hypothetical protein PR002_g31343 [Phytophthora rubi]
MTADRRVITALVMACAESSADSAIASLASPVPPAASSLDSAGVLFLSSFSSPLRISSSSPSLSSPGRSASPTKANT